MVQTGLLSKNLIMSWVWYNDTDEQANTWGGWGYSFAMVSYDWPWMWAVSAWNPVTLDTENYDDDGIVSLSSNQFTLIEGTYIINWYYYTYDSSWDYGRLYNITDAAYVIDWSGCFSDTSDPCTSLSIVAWKIEVGSWGETFELRSGEGRQTNTPSWNSVWDSVQLIKIA